MSNDSKDLDVVGSSDKNKKDETVEVKKSVFDALQERLNRLESSADKKQLARYDVSHRESYGEVIGVRTFNGKRVVSWTDMVENSVKKDPRTKVWTEDQTIKIKFEDGKEERIPYEVFVSSSGGYTLEMGTVKDKKVENVNVKDRNGKIIEKRQQVVYLLEMDDGKILEISSKYVN